MIRYDCFAYVGTKTTPKCRALTNCICAHSDTCSFYKTKEQNENLIERGYKVGKWYYLQHNIDKKF
jgi:hypothetical protein